MQFRFSALILSTVLAFSAHADSAKDGLASELAFIKRIFQTAYAPAEWKKQQFGWDLNTEYQKVSSELASKTEITPQDYRRMISSFVRSTHDYHVWSSFLSTEAASLPIQIMGQNGKYYIVRIEKSKLNETTFPFRVGDEVVSFGGRPINDVVTEIRNEQAVSVESTDQRLAELFLTRRGASMAMDVPQGFIDIEVRREGQADTIKRQLTWQYSGERIPWNPTSATFNPMGTLPSKSGGLRKPIMTWGRWETFASIAGQQKPKQEEDLFDIGGRKSYVPRLGPVIWETAESDAFDAYIYKNDKNQLIGYVRIPHYMGSNEVFAEFRKVVKRFQEVTDGMIIDEINNPGGSVFYVYALMSVLSNQPMVVPHHQITIYPAMMKENSDLAEQLAKVTNDDEAKAAFQGEALDGFPINFQFAQSVLRYTRDVSAEWNAGHRLTRLLPLWGVDRINPDPEVAYTKPILVLVNELDFSGGDFFPAILQDNKRVKIFGQRTSGAGGYVGQVQFPSSLGLAGFSFTGSIAKRVDGHPIENLGVTPDIPYALTERDFKEGFVDYKNAIKAAIDGML